ncbi:TOBE domain-containing protein, partial [Pseudomonas anguilliseptica]
HIRGIVAKVVSDKVMSQVELVTGNLSIVSLVSTEAVRELGLQVGSIAVAQVKATNVSLQLPVTR